MNQKSLRPTLTFRIFIASVTALCGLTLLSTRAQTQAPQYSVTVLGDLGSGFSYGYGINDAGQVAGVNNGRAVRWTGATPTDLLSVTATASEGYGINDSGQVVGHYHPNGFNASPAMRWTGTTGEILVNTLGGTYSDAYGINASGQVAGYSYLAGNSVRHAARWTGTTQTDLGTLGGNNSIGFGINDAGQVAGWANNPQGQQRAVRWTGTTPTDLGLGLGYGINAAGQVVGTGSVGHAVVWAGTTPTDLGTLGGAGSVGYGINDIGDVIGMSYVTGNATQHAFLYTSGTMYDLNDLLLPGSGVTGLTINAGGNSINDVGQIAASGVIDGQTHALRLNPVAAPEPSSAFLALGSGMMLLLRRRRAPI